MSISIIKAIKDPHLFRGFLQDENGKLGSWVNWSIVLRMIYGLPIKEKHAELVKKLSGRTIESLPKEGFSSSLLLVGRRGGKSSVSSVIAAFEAVLGGGEEHLSPGETGLISVVSPTRLQSKIIRNYVRAAFNAPLLEGEIVSEDKEGFLLQNNVRIQVLTGSHRSIRGFTNLLTVLDECCFFGHSEESKETDSQIIQAIRPSLLTSRGRLLAISTKYRKAGWAYKIWKQNFGNDNGSVLVVDAPSILMNNTLDQQEIDNIIAEDPVANRAEFLNLWREDISAYVGREIIESCVVKNRIELLPKTNLPYTAFCDLSGGRDESASLAISHKVEDKIVLDFVKEYRSPFNPTAVIEKMVTELKRYEIMKIRGDKYAGNFVSGQFQRLGVQYVPSDKSKSIIYLEFIPIVSSRACELLDHERMINQFSNLQRKTRSGGADAIDHVAGFKDDVCNSVAGTVVYSGAPTIRAGAL